MRRNPSLPARRNHVATGSNKGDAAWNSQERQTEERSITGTGKPFAGDSVLEIDLETPQEYETSVESIALMERVHIRLRITMNRHTGGRMEDLDMHALIWDCLCLEL